MSNFQNRVNFIWAVADEVLRDDIKRGKYLDVILPFTVLRRLDCVLVMLRMFPAGNGAKVALWSRFSRDRKPSACSTRPRLTSSFAFTGRLSHHCIS